MEISVPTKGQQTEWHRVRAIDVQPYSGAVHSLGVDLPCVSRGVFMSCLPWFYLATISLIGPAASCNSPPSKVRTPA